LQAALQQAAEDKDAAVTAKDEQLQPLINALSTAKAELTEQLAQHMEEVP